MENLRVTISGTGGDQQLDLAALAGIPGNAPAGLAADALREEMRRTLSRFEGVRAAAVSTLLDALPLVEFERQVGALVEQVDPASREQRGREVFDGIFAELGAGELPAVLDQLAVRDVGIAFTRRQIGAAPPSPARPGTPASSEGQVLVNLMAGTLRAAVPAVAVAELGVKAIQAIGEMDLAVEKLRQIDREVNQLLAEELHLHDQVSESRLNVALTRLDQRISRAIVQGTLRQLEIDRQTLRGQAAQIREDQARLLARIPLTLYLSERLREEYDALDRSLALWVGDAASPRGAIARWILEDPSKTRYLLDADIHLQDWLDRESEGRRDNYDALLNHWRQVYQLVEDLCQGLGCSDTNRVLGEVQQTDPLLLSKLVSSDEWQRFQAWKQQDSGAPIDLWFLIHPGLPIVGSRHQNIRIVDVWVRGRRGRESEVLSRFYLHHPGIASVPVGGTLVDGRRR